MWADLEALRTLRDNREGWKNNSDAGDARRGICICGAMAWSQWI